MEFFHLIKEAVLKMLNLKEIKSWARIYRRIWRKQFEPGTICFI